MLGKRSSQDKLFDADQQYLSFVGADSFYGYLAQHRHELFHDEDFASLYCLTNGRTSVPPSLLACTLLLQWYDSVSDEETVARVKFDLRWKVALGLDMEAEPFVKSTLWLFRTQLIVHQQARKLFDLSLKQARKLGYFKSRKISVALDTTPIFGKGAVEDTYNLLAESLRQVLNVLAGLEKTSVEQYATTLDLARYTAPSFKGTVSIDWDNPAERNRVLQTLVADCERVLALARTVLSAYPAESEQAKQIIEATELLAKILVQDVHRFPSGEAQLIDGVARDRIVSVHDPEMRHGRKSVSQRFNGYKASVAADADSQLVTAVDVLDANQHDSTRADELVDQTEQSTGAKVETVLGDSAYGTAEQRLAARDQNRTLVAPVPKAPSTGRFTKEDFTIDLVNDIVTCPAGKSTTLWYADIQKTKRGKRFRGKSFRFSPEDCQACPLSAQCLKPGATWRSIRVHQHEALIRAARDFQRTDQFRQLYRKRVVIEHRFARLVQLGLRKARYFGKAKTLFQLAMTAAVANLSLIASEVNKRLSFFFACVQTGLSLLLYVPPRAQQITIERNRRAWPFFLGNIACGLTVTAQTPTFRLCF